MKFVGKEIVGKQIFSCIVECTSCYVRDKANAYCIEMGTAHPNIGYFIIGAEMDEVRKHYKMLSLEEAEQIMDVASNSKIINLQELGNYQICRIEKWQTVFIRNDIDEYTDEDIPIIVEIPEKSVRED